MVNGYYDFPVEKNDYFSYINVSKRCQLAIEKNGLTWLPDLIWQHQEFAKFKETTQQKWFLERRHNNRNTSNLAITCYNGLIEPAFESVLETFLIKNYSLEVDKLTLLFINGHCFLEDETDSTISSSPGRNQFN